MSLLEMDMKSALLTTLFVGGFCCLFPAYFTLFGPKLGMRQMIQCRYSFGYFGASLICVLNAATMLGYCILNSIVGGQTLSAVSSRAMEPQRLPQTWHCGGSVHRAHRLV